MFTMIDMFSRRRASLAATAISRQRPWRARIGAVLLASLVGCGGNSASPGGDANSSSPGGDGGAATPSLVITQSNAVPVAAEALVTAAGLGANATVGAPSSPPDAQVAANRLRVISRTAVQHMNAGAISDPCAISGTMTTTASNAISGTETFDNCVDIADTSLTGTLTYTDLVSNVSTTEYHISANVVVNLTVSHATLSYTEVGDYTFDAMSPAAVVLEISGTSLTFTLVKAGAVFDEITLSNYDERFGVDPTATPEQGSVTVNYTVASKRLGGQFTVTTMATIKQLIGLRFPYAGQLLSTGAGNTRLQMTIVGDETYSPPPGQGQVELRLDPGTGVLGAPTWTSWDALFADATSNP